MADIKYMKAVEYDKLPAKFKKNYTLIALGKLGYWLQRKYDGCFGKATIRDDRTMCTMQSREGNDYSLSCAHILNELHELCSIHGPFEPTVFLGEAWKKGIKFPEISGRFRRQSQGPQDLDFVINDVLPLHMETEVSYKQRFAIASEFVYEGKHQPRIMLAETFEFWDDTDGPLPHALRWKNEGGFDGAILRNPDAGYTFGLVKDGAIIKVKPVMSLDLACLTIIGTKGDKTGRDVYTIQVKYRGVVSNVGSGVPHKPEDLPDIGQIVQIDSMGLTEDGKLREPRFIAIRTDKDTADE